jgi:multisubunit Na+/H+ antiporter MnhG subunit
LQEFIFSLVSNLFLLRAGANLNYTYESILLLIIGFIIYISTKQPLQFKFILLLLLLFVINNKVSQPLYLKEAQSEETKKAYFENLESGKILKKFNWQ